MNYIKSKPSKNEYTRHEIIDTLKCARGVMELLERENMNILLSQANQVYIKNNENGLLVCLNDMRDSFNVVVEREKAEICKKEIKIMSKTVVEEILNIFEREEFTILEALEKNNECKLQILRNMLINENLNSSVRTINCKNPVTPEKVSFEQRKILDQLAKQL